MMVAMNHLSRVRMLIFVAWFLRKLIWFDQRFKLAQTHPFASTGHRFGLLRRIGRNHCRWLCNSWKAWAHLHLSRPVHDATVVTGDRKKSPYLQFILRIEGGQFGSWFFSHARVSSLSGLLPKTGWVTRCGAVVMVERVLTTAHQWSDCLALLGAAGKLAHFSSLSSH